MNKEQIKEQAERYLDRIAFEVSSFDRHGELRKPTVVMSMDIASVITASADVVRFHSVGAPMTIAGYPVKLLPFDKSTLFVGFDLLEDYNEQREAD